ncbi:hypothetical protein IFT75_04255 [Pseudomonas sp. CFBP 8758]|uniref:hypothetical protein n=1 Tax=Pseudomonas sp. CFBP 8758 TaxID=2775286 RepID=UPI00177DA46A|nr:hypothetical protein [Pseudomonas sp. CFBP 8758]MBD8592617.1 hypothetical protein [Pseudomonas sp. CFBP 8758]
MVDRLAKKDKFTRNRPKARIRLPFKKVMFGNCNVEKQFQPWPRKRSMQAITTLWQDLWGN